MGKDFLSNEYVIEVIKMRKFFLLIVVTFICLIFMVYSSFGNQANNPQLDVKGDIPKDTLIKLKRGGGFMIYPRYELTIYGDGKVIFDGYRNIKGEMTSGLIESKISQKKVKEILKEFQKADFFNFSSDAFSGAKCRGVTDASTAVTFIRYNGEEKSVEHYQGCFDAPKALTKLEDKIDEIVNTKQWTK